MYYYLELYYKFIKLLLFVSIAITTLMSFATNFRHIEYLDVTIDSVNSKYVKSTLQCTLASGKLFLLADKLSNKEKLDISVINFKNHENAVIAYEQYYD